MTIRQLFARNGSGATSSQRRRNTCRFSSPTRPGDDIDAHAVVVEHFDQAVDLPRRRLQLRQIGRLRRLKRDQVRMAGDEGHQVELAEHADHGVSLAHDHAMDAMAQHQDHRIVEFVVDRD